MAKYIPHTYKNGRARRILIRVIVILLVLAATALVVLFFLFRQYIVISPDGLHLEIPWLEGYY
ncbi:MAG: TMEM106 family protein [Oscillospiraceae bacterium]|jgi:hypothetical protein|nr:TMEM106 family protein [Oscillospiraceae bacterium]